MKKWDALGFVGIPAARREMIVVLECNRCCSQKRVPFSEIEDGLWDMELPPGDDCGCEKADETAGSDKQ